MALAIQSEQFGAQLPNPATGEILWNGIRSPWAMNSDACSALAILAPYTTADNQPGDQMDVITAIDSVLAVGDYAQLASILDQAELQEPSGSFPPQWPFALHLLAHIYSSQLEDARFLYKRMPDEAKQSSTEVQKSFELLQRLWNKDYENLWGTLDYSWPQQLQPLVQALASKLRADMLRLVMQAYANLSAHKLGVLLGLTEAQAAQLAVEQGWEADPTSGLLLVKPKVEAVQTRASQQQLQRLAEYVVHLET